MGNICSDCTEKETSEPLRQGLITTPPPQQPMSKAESKSNDVTALNLASFSQMIQESNEYSKVSDEEWLQEKKGGGGQQQNDEAALKKELVKKDYRAFCFLLHETHGLLLLYCTRKKKKPPHDQLPGGHVDAEDFDLHQQAAKDHRQRWLYLAARTGCARELWEETGMDLRGPQKEYRLKPVLLHKQQHDNDKDDVLVNEHKHRLFFVVQVTDDDFTSQADAKTKNLSAQRTWMAPRGGADASSHLKLPLSFEHQGFSFETEPAKALERLQYHSGGKISEALQMALGK